MRRAAWPLREAMSTLYRDPIPLIDDEERIYLRDCYDHMVQIIDLLENYRDVTSGLMEVYLSSVSNRTNEIMKLLTMITIVLGSLTLIAGIYGMNFNPGVSPWNMPELVWRWAIRFALGLMARGGNYPFPIFPEKRMVGNPPRRMGNRENRLIDCLACSGILREIDENIRDLSCGESNRMEAMAGSKPRRCKMRSGNEIRKNGNSLSIFAGGTMKNNTKVGILWFGLASLALLLSGIAYSQQQALRQRRKRNRHLALAWARPLVPFPRKFLAIIE